MVWEENNVVPHFVLEIVAKTPGGEYGSKLRLYAEIGVTYYAIYNPDYWQRDRHEPFEVYKLVDGIYRRQSGQPVWMKEMGLGIGRQQGTHDGLTREWLYWYDAQGNQHPAPENVIQQERQRAEQAERRAELAEQQVQRERQLREDLLRQLRARGIDPENLGV